MFNGHEQGSSQEAGIDNSAINRSARADRPGQSKRIRHVVRRHVALLVKCIHLLLAERQGQPRPSPSHGNYGRSAAHREVRVAHFGHVFPRLAAFCADTGVASWHMLNNTLRQFSHARAQEHALFGEGNAAKLIQPLNEGNNLNRTATWHPHAHQWSPMHI
eukprot:scaffold1466_cov385-Prasinococcus_capsulatus_cf.AAC.11